MRASATLLGLVPIVSLLASIPTVIARFDVDGYPVRRADNIVARQQPSYSTYDGPGPTLTGYHYGETTSSSSISLSTSSTSDDPVPVVDESLDSRGRSGRGSLEKGGGFEVVAPAQETQDPPFPVTNSSSTVGPTGTGTGVGTGVSTPPFPMSNATVSAGPTGTGTGTGGNFGTGTAGAPGVITPSPHLDEPTATHLPFTSTLGSAPFPISNSTSGFGTGTGTAAGTGFATGTSAGTGAIGTGISSNLPLSGTGDATGFPTGSQAPFPLTNTTYLAGPTGTAGGTGSLGATGVGTVGYDSEATTSCSTSSETETSSCTESATTSMYAPELDPPAPYPEATSTSDVDTVFTTIWWPEASMLPSTSCSESDITFSSAVDAIATTTGPDAYAEDAMTTIWHDIAPSASSDSAPIWHDGTPSLSLDDTTRTCSSTSGAEVESDAAATIYTTLWATPQENTIAPTVGAPEDTTSTSCSTSTEATLPVDVSATSSIEPITVFTTVWSATEEPTDSSMMGEATPTITVSVWEWEGEEVPDSGLSTATPATSGDDIGETATATEELTPSDEPTTFVTVWQTISSCTTTSTWTHDGSTGATVFVVPTTVPVISVEEESLSTSTPVITPIPFRVGGSFNRRVVRARRQ